MSGPPGYQALAPDSPVELRHVEQELLALRRRAQRTVDDERPDDQPITRACMSNLLVYCDSHQEADRLPEQFARMARRHPARIIVLVGQEPGTPTESRAHLQAGLVQLGKRPQLSSEQIRIQASRDEHDRLASAARPFVIGDLPTALWWNSTRPPAQAGALFEALQDMTSSVIYDSRGWRDPRSGLIATANWVLGARRRKLVADLAWMRLRIWRRLFGEALAPRALPGALQGIEALRLEHGPHALPMVCLFVGWLAHALGWKPRGGQATSDRDLRVLFLSPQGPLTVTIERRDEGPADLQRAVVTTRTPVAPHTPLRVEFEALARQRIAIRVGDGAHRQSIVATPDEPQIVTLAWQLTKRTGQREFREAIARARDAALELAS